MTTDRLIGRGLALCVHPAAAWPRLSGRSRMVLVAAYFVSGFLGVLGGLLVL